MKQLLASLAIALSFGGLALGDGTIIVLNKADATASLFDRDTHQQRARLETRTGPHEVAISPDGATAVIANYGDQTPGSSLSVVDIASAKVLRVIELEGYHRPHGLQFLNDGQRLVVTAEQEKCLLIVDIDAGRVEDAIRTDQSASHMVVVSPDSARAYVSNIVSGSVTVIDLKTSSAIKSIPTGGGAEGLDVSPDGSQLWVANRADDTICVIDTASLETLETFSCGAFPIRLKFTPDGGRALVSCAESGDVAVIDTTSRKEVARVSMATGADRSGMSGDPVPIGILIPASGNTAFIANSSADLISMIDLETYEVSGSFHAGPVPDGMGFSPVTVKSP